jgi:hypothetical protein
MASSQLFPSIMESSSSAIYQVSADDHSDHFKSMIQYEKELVEKRHLLIFQLRNPKVYQEFSEFMNYSKSSFFLFLVNLIFTFLVIPLVGCSTFTSDMATTACSVLEIIISFCMLCFMWLLLCRQIAKFQDNKIFSNLRKVSIEWLQECYLFSVTALFAIINIRRVYQGQCSADTPWISIWSCNPNGKSNGIPFDSFFIMLLIPIVFVVVLRETNFLCVFLCWFIVVSTLLTCVIMLGSAHPSLALIFYFVFSSVIIIDAYNQYILLFTLGRKLKERLEENQRLSDQEKAIQMRNMIANIAHDLKTVRKKHTCRFVICISLFCFFSLALSIVYDWNRTYFQ